MHPPFKPHQCYPPISANILPFSKVQPTHPSLFMLLLLPSPSMFTSVCPLQTLRPSGGVCQMLGLHHSSGWGGREDERALLLLAVWENDKETAGTVENVTPYKRILQVSIKNYGEYFICSGFACVVCLLQSSKCPYDVTGKGFGICSLFEFVEESCCV